MPDSIQLTNVAIFGRIFVDDDPQELLQSIKELEVPDELTHQVVSVDGEDVEDATMYYADSMPSGPGGSVISTGEINMIVIQYGEEDLTLAADFDHTLREDFVRFFDGLLEIVDIHISDFDVSFEIERDFQDLSFAISGPEDFVFNGVQFSKDGVRYTLQAVSSDDEQGSNNVSDNSEEVPGEEEPQTAVESEQAQHFDVEDSGEFVNEKIDQMVDTIAEIVP